MQIEYLQSKFKQKVHPLGGNPVFDGLYALKPDYLESELVGVTAQFLENASVCGADYFNELHRKNLVQLGLSQNPHFRTRPGGIGLGLQIGK